MVEKPECFDCKSFLSSNLQHFPVILPIPHVLFVEHVSFPLQQELIIGKIQRFVFPQENQLRQQTSASRRAVLLIQLAEQIPLSCLSSWKLYQMTYILSSDSGLRLGGVWWESEYLHDKI